MVDAQAPLVAQTKSVIGLMEATEFDPKECLSRAQGLIREFKLNLPKKIYAADLSVKSKIPFKAVPLREVLLYRLTELAEVACMLYEENRIVSAFIMTRCVMETVAMLYWLYKRIEQVVQSNDLGDMDTFLMRAMFGWRDDSMPAQAFNILKAIDQMDKQFPSYRALYDSLSEFTHPNWSGVHGAYARIDKENFAEDLGPEFTEPPLVIGLLPLATSLEAFKFYYNKLSDMFPAFIKICDADIDKKNI